MIKHTFNLARRHFLITGGMFSAALVGGSFLYRTHAETVRYCAITPEVDDLSPVLEKTDLSWVAAEKPKTVAISDLGDEYFKGLRTLLTIVDNDGKNVRRLWVPGLLHTGSFWGDLLLLVTRGASSVFYALDVNKLEIVSYALPDEDYFFGGHVIPWIETGQFAVTANKQKEGAYDRVDIYDVKQLKKIASLNSFGFQAHELALSPDKKTLYVGHYGSYYTSGPYRRLYAEHQQRLHAQKGNILFQPDITYYPGSVSVVDLSNQTLSARLSDTRNGAQGHLSPSAEGEIFLSRFPPLLQSRDKTLVDPVFSQGLDHKICSSSMYNASSFMSSGTTVVVDNLEKQYLLPCTHASKMIYGSLSNPDQMKDSGLTEYSHFRRPCGLAFHPDGKHYVVSCENGFALLKRGTHDYNAEASLRLRLALHSHMCAG